MHTSSAIHKLTNEILMVTSIIQNNYPSFYETLTETPLQDTGSGVALKESDLSEYLEFLKTQLSVLEGRK